MRLQAKIWLASGIVIASIMSVDLFLGYQNTESEVRRELDEDAQIIRSMLMATRRVYHEQFLASGLPLNEHTLGFLPAHALSRISADFPNWLNTRLSFNNVSDHARNPRNQADSDELAAMDWFRFHETATDLVRVIRDAKGAEIYHFTTPIRIEAYCLKCHGGRADAPPTIRDEYDGAYDYQVGELRGVMSIKLPMDELRHRTLHAWWQRYSIRAGGYGILVLLLGVLMQQIVTRRLAKLEFAACRLSSGDLGARVSLSGSDEVALLGQSFNGMAASIEKHQSELERLNAIYAALSETNQTILRVENETELLESICRIAVELGGLKLAWIGAPDASRSQLLVVTQYGGAVEYLQDIYIALHPEDPAAHGPSGTAWRTRLPVIVQDFLADASTVPWRERARPFGWGSCASFPVMRGGDVHLVLSLYHDEKQAFDAKMVELLTEMAMDIGYALDHIDLVLANKRNLLVLQESEEKYHNAISTALDGFWIVDDRARMLDVNDAYLKFSGYSREEFLKLSIQDIEAVHSPEQVALNMENIKLAGGALFESLHRTKTGEIRPVEVSVSFMPGQVERFSAFIRDLSDREQALAQIDALSHYNTLTGLPNRTLFADRFSLALGYAQRNQEALSLIFLDIDHFKNINDNLGHRVGDLLLIALTDRFQRVLRTEDTVSRLGGDEFILLLPHAAAESAAHVAEKLLETTVQPLSIEGHEMIVTTSMGIAVFPIDGENFETLLRKADTAANWVKQEGRNGFRFFAGEMQERSSRVLKLQTALRRALERDELLLHYQPQLSLKTGAIVGVEALIRWLHPEHGLISPAEFIPIAESSGLILPIGEWVLDTAMRQMKLWMDKGLLIQHVAVNLSAEQFRQQDLLSVVGRLLAENGLPAACLELELTESMTMADPVAAVAVLDALCAKGIRISIDDFGTGYSSLSYLKRFQVHKLKIDQSFVRDITVDPENKAIVIAIVSLAKSLGLETVAEGVETVEQREFLRLQGCDVMQGYLFSKPVPGDLIEAMFLENSG